MVIGRNRLIATLLTLGFFLICDIAMSAELSLQLDSREIEYGRVFIGTLNYRGKSGTGPADLRPWEEEFLVERDNFSAEEKAGEIISHEDIRLYPRFSGDLVINAIAHGGVIMEPIKVKVRPLQRNGIDGQPILEPLPKKVQVGTPIKVAVTVPLLAPTNKVSTSDWSVPGMTVVALPQQHETRQGQDVIKLRWRLYPAAKGSYRLALPAIQQRGNGRWRFHLPLQEIAVFPLPSYLPPTLPVGTLSASSGLIHDDKQPYWQVTLTSDGLLDSHPWGLQRTLASALGIDEASINSGEASIDAQGWWHRSWTMPVPQWTVGLLHGPTLSIRFFSPRSQRLETLDHLLPAATRLPGWFIAVLALVGMILFAGVIILLRRVAHRIRHYRHHLHLLHAATDAHALRRELLRYHRQRHLEAWAAATGTLQATQTAANLNALSFSRHSDKSFAAVKTSVLRIESPKRQLQQVVSKLIRGSGFIANFGHRR